MGYWKETDGKLVVAGDYVTPARKAALTAKGKTASFAEASKEYQLDASGNGPVATVLKTDEPLYIQDVATCDTMKRGSLAGLGYQVTLLGARPGWRVGVWHIRRTMHCGLDLHGGCAAGNHAQG